jgi:hypothetical protein
MRALVVLVLATMPSAAWAQQLPETQPAHKGFRVEVGLSDNHAGRDRRSAGAFRAFGFIDDRGLVSIEGGILMTPYLGGDGGMDVRVPIRPRLSLLARGGAGVLWEDESYLGPFWRYGGGIEVLLSTKNRMTITYQRGGHENTSATDIGHDFRDGGPHLLMVGWEYRVGGR